MRPICVPCACHMHCEKNGVYFVTLLPDGRRYHLWSGDKWKCRQCGHESIVGVGQNPIAEHWEKDFALKVTLVQIVDLVRSPFPSKIGTAMAEGIVARPIEPLFDQKMNRVIIKLKTKDFIAGKR